MYMCLFLGFGSLCYDLCVNFCFDYCIFVLLSEHRKHDIPSFVLFQDCSDYLWVFFFLYVCGSVFILRLFILLLLFSCSVMSDSLQPRGLYPTRLLCPWDFTGKDTEVGCHFLLWGNIGIFLTQGSNPCLLRLLA